jgi:hypothetical protein
MSRPLSQRKGLCRFRQRPFLLGRASLESDAQRALKLACLVTFAHDCSQVACGKGWLVWSQSERDQYPLVGYIFPCRDSFARRGKRLPIARKHVHRQRRTYARALRNGSIAPWHSEMASARGIIHGWHVAKDVGLLRRENFMVKNPVRQL